MNIRIQPTSPWKEAEFPGCFPFNTCDILKNDEEVGSIECIMFDYTNTHPSVRNYKNLYDCFFDISGETYEIAQLYFDKYGFPRNALKRFLNQHAADFAHPDDGELDLTSQHPKTPRFLYISSVSFGSLTMQEASCAMRKFLLSNLTWLPDAAVLDGWGAFIPDNRMERDVFASIGFLQNPSCRLGCMWGTLASTFDQKQALLGTKWKSNAEAHSLLMKTREVLEGRDVEE